jgi:predicted enzyme related to lactoylglutathione lyase
MSDNTVQTVAPLEEVTQHPHGAFAWTELYTTDFEAAKAFYGDLFGWSYQDQPVPGDLRYSLCLVNGKPVGGLMDMPPGEREAGVGAYWGVYIHVDDLDAALAKLGPAGGSVLGEPFEIPESGRMAMVKDATGATLGLWQMLPGRGSAYRQGAGVPVWHEMWTRDVAGAAAFYQAVLGWQTHLFEYEGHPTASCYNGEQQVALIMAIREEWGDVPPMWAVYFGADVDAGLARVRALGGSVVMEPREVEGMRFALVHDAQGAMFYLVDAPK